MKEHMVLESIMCENAQGTDDYNDSFTDPISNSRFLSDKRQ